MPSPTRRHHALVPAWTSAGRSFGADIAERVLDAVDQTEVGRGRGLEQPDLGAGQSVGGIGRRHNAGYFQLAEDGGQHMHEGNFARDTDLDQIFVFIFEYLQAFFQRPD